MRYKMKDINLQDHEKISGAGGIFSGIGAINSGIGAVTGAATDSDYDHLGRPVYGMAGKRANCEAWAQNVQDDKKAHDELYHECMADPKGWGWRK